MSSRSDLGFFPASAGRAASSPNLLKGLKLSSVKQLKSPLPKPNLRTSPSVHSPVMASPSSPSSPSKAKAKGDRFIPDRSSLDFSVSSFALTRTEPTPTDASPNIEHYKRSLARSIFEPESVEVVAGISTESPSRVPSDAIVHYHSDSIRQNKGSLSSPQIASPKSPSKMLSYSPKTAADPNSPQSHRVLFAQMQSPRRRCTVRVIPTVPERVLDAPGLIDDYYLNLLDWSSQNDVAIALGASVYLWNAPTGESHQLMTLDGRQSYVASISFSGSGQYLAIGTHDNLVKIYDIQASKLVRTLRGHSARIGSLSWNDQILSSGSRDSSIINHDVRLASPVVSTFEGHCNEVCGLRWSPDGTQLASGSNDNLLNIWSLSYTRPVFTLAQHTAAVKAISWCPWQRNLLASGGGTADKTIKFWNTSTGACLHSLDTKSQVCSLQWSKHVKELVSSHGFSQNQLAIWKYPTMVKQAELTGHGNRVLHTAMSPDGTTVVSAAADETLRFWRVFDVEASLSRLPKAHSEVNLRKRMLR